MNCIYCNREENYIDKKSGKPVPFTQEHILPSSLVGTLEKNEHFTIHNVHEYCNNVAGMFIDAQAIRNYHVSMILANNASKFANIEERPILPLRSIGKHTKTYGSKVCDLWIGPAGSQIFHFHEPYPDDGEPATIGQPVSLKHKIKLDHGFAFLFISNTNTVWYPTIVWSFINHFKSTTLYLGNHGPTPKGGHFSAIPSELISLKDELLKITGDEHTCEAYYTPNCEVRFLAKIALGIGGKLFSETFSNSEYATRLRNYMWARTAEERQQHLIHGTGFMSNSTSIEDLKEIFGWEGGHVLAIVPAFNTIGVHFNIYNSITATISLGKFEEEYKEVVGAGLIYVIVPSLRRIVGPIRLPKYIAHKTARKETKHPELLEIEELLEKRKNKPPLNINDKEV